MVAPALRQSGVPDFAAHMFIFYYAVLSEVSPPTALSPFAAAALTGGEPVPDDDADLEVHAAGLRRAVRVHARVRAGSGLLLAGRGRPSPSRVLTAALGVAALAWRAAAAGCAAKPRGRNAVGLTVGGTLLFYAAPVGGYRRRLIISVAGCSGVAPQRGRPADFLACYRMRLRRREHAMTQTFIPDGQPRSRPRRCLLAARPRRQSAQPPSHHAEGALRLQHRRRLSPRQLHAVHRLLAEARQASPTG